MRLCESFFLLVSVSWIQLIMKGKGKGKEVLIDLTRS